MAEIHHFAHGWFSPGFAYVVSFVGSLLGLYCTTRARDAHPSAGRTRWLVLASGAIGGGGIWLMHFTAMMGFDVVGTVVRYDLTLTMVSLLMSVFSVGVGLFLVGSGKSSFVRIVAGGFFTGMGVFAMHYTGMAALHTSGTVEYDTGLVLASAAIAIVASTVALWFTVAVRGWRPIVAASAIMGVAVAGMHYTGMAAVRVHLDPNRIVAVEGTRPVVLVVSIMVLAALAMIVMAVVALQTMMKEEFDDEVASLNARHASVV
jgi:NO-binding membrane sensor protein with MHYT domain